MTLHDLPQRSYDPGPAATPTNRPFRLSGIEHLVLIKILLPAMSDRQSGNELDEICSNRRALKPRTYADADVMFPLSVVVVFDLNKTIYLSFYML